MLPWLNAAGTVQVGICIFQKSARVITNVDAPYCASVNVERPSAKYNFYRYSLIFSPYYIFIFLTL